MEMEELIKILENLQNFPEQMKELKRLFSELEDRIVILENSELRPLKDEDDLLTISEVIKQYGISRTHWYKRRKEKKLEEFASYGKGKKLFKRVDVEKALYKLRA